jgi:hypothetical protein
MVLFHFLWGKLSGKRSGNGLAPQPGFSRRSRALLLGGSELASRPRFYGRSPGSSDNFASRLLPSRLPSNEGSGRLNPPWSLRPSPDRFPFLPIRNGRDPKVLKGGTEAALVLEAPECWVGGSCARVPGQPPRHPSSSFPRSTYYIRFQEIIRTGVSSP